MDSTSKENTNKKHRNRPGLIPTVAVYLIIAVITIMTIGLVVSRSLSDISELATDTRDTVLPSILSHQRTAINLDKLGRFAETIYRARDAKTRRQYKLAARVLSQDSVFEENETVNRTVVDAYHGIERLAKLRVRQEEIAVESAKTMISFGPNKPAGQSFKGLVNGQALVSLLIRIDNAPNLDALTKLEAELAMLIPFSVKEIAASTEPYKTIQRFLSLREKELRIGLQCTALWDQINISLDNLSDKLAVSAAVTADDRFTTIAATADQAMHTSLLAAGALLLSLTILLFMAQRDIVSPILQYVKGLNNISQGAAPALPPARLKELDAIRKAVERSGSLMAQIANRTDALEKANKTLEEEIEERISAQRKLAWSKERAEAADQAKSDFLAGMSHEIRTPMNTILGMADLMLETDPSVEQRQYIEIFQSSGEMLLNIINDVLDLSKIESGEIGLEETVITLKDFLNRTREIVAGRAVQKGLSFSVDVDKDVPPQIVGDPIRLRQVLVNLIDNGVKFTEEGSVRLTIHAEDPEHPARLTFRVIDTGIGIPQNVQDQIFRRFTQADASTTRQYGGTGLGLSICRRLVKLMDGTITLNSTPDAGSTFQFTLDFTLPDEQTAPQPQHPKDMDELVAALSGMSTKILVAEDSDSNQALIELYFSKTDCTLDFAADGQQAVDLFTTKKYDLVLMDIQMPVMDGYEATRSIRALEAEQGTGPIPIVAVTANAFMEDQRRCLDAGCTDYLAKPVSKAGLLQCVAHYVDRKG